MRKLLTAAMILFCAAGCEKSKTQTQNPLVGKWATSTTSCNAYESSKTVAKAEDFVEFNDNKMIIGLKKPDCTELREYSYKMDGKSHFTAYSPVITKKCGGSELNKDHRVSFNFEKKNEILILKSDDSILTNCNLLVKN